MSGCIMLGYTHICNPQIDTIQSSIYVKIVLLSVTMDDVTLKAA